MNIIVGLKSGNLIIINLFRTLSNFNYKLTSNIQFCSDEIKPIILIDNESMLIGLEKKVIKFISTKNQKSIFSIDFSNKKFNHICFFQSMKHLLFVTSKNFIYVWKK